MATKKTVLNEKTTQGYDILYPETDINYVLDIPSGKTAKELIDESQVYSKHETFISTEGQTVFILQNGTYVINDNRLEVIVGGVHQYSPSNFIETSSDRITFNSPLSQGLEVIINYFSGSAAISSDLEAQINQVDTKINNHINSESLHNHFSIATGINNLSMTIENVTNLQSGLTIRFKNSSMNTGAVTLNVNSLGIKNVLKSDGNPLNSGKLKMNGLYTVVYDGTSFFLQGEGGEYGTATASQVLSGYTLGTENGVVSGAITIKNSQIYTPGISNQIITSNQYLNGNQTILGDSDLISDNIKNGVDIFGVIGNLSPLIKASGTLSPQSSALSFQRASSTSSPVNSYYGIITGLTFKPDILFIKNKTPDNSNVNTLTFYINPDLSLLNYYYREVVHLASFDTEGSSASYNTGTFKADVGNAYINETGAQLPLALGTSSFLLYRQYEWFAYKVI